MQESRDNSQLLEQVITHALDKRREIVVPAEFAGRVMRSLPPRRSRRPRMPVGRTASMVGMVALALAMFALAPHSTAQFTNFAFDLELLLLVQLGGIAWWMAGQTVVGR